MANARNPKDEAPKDFPKTQAVVVCNLMAPPLAPRIVIDALPALMERIPETLFYSSREEQVAVAVNTMSAVYKNLGRAHYIQQPDFEDPAYQLAYVYQYFTKHCHLIYQMLWMLLPFKVARRWLERGVNVCSIGGGPGTDVVGVLIYLRSVRSYLRSATSERVMGYVLDKFGAWGGAWSALRASNTVLRESQIYCTYITCDLLDELPTAATEQEIRQADLVTLIKSISAFIAFLRDGRDIGQCAVTKLLKQLKRGAVVLFIDNKDDVYVNGSWASGHSFVRKSQNETFLQDIAEEAGLKVLNEWHGTTDTRLDRGDHGHLKRYKERFKLDHHNPGLRRCGVSVFLLQKQ